MRCLVSILTVFVLAGCFIGGMEILLIVNHAAGFAAGADILVGDVYEVSYGIFEAAQEHNFRVLGCSTTFYETTFDIWDIVFSSVSPKTC